MSDRTFLPDNLVLHAARQDEAQHGEGVPRGPVLRVPSPSTHSWTSRARTSDSDTFAHLGATWLRHTESFPLWVCGFIPSPGVTPVGSARYAASLVVLREDPHLPRLPHRRARGVPPVGDP